MEMVEVDGTVKAQTDLAILLTDGDSDDWIPLSLIEDSVDYEIGENTTVSIPEWFAIEKGLA